MDGAYLCCRCPSYQNNTKGRQKVVADVKLLTRFLKLWWFPIQKKNFCIIASQNINLSDALEKGYTLPFGSQAAHPTGCKTPTYEIRTLWEGDRGEVLKVRIAVLLGQEISNHMSVREPSTTGWRCWAGASWPVTPSFHTVVFCFDTIVTTQKKSENW